MEPKKKKNKETIEQFAVRQRKRRKELQAEMSPYRRKLSEKMAADPLKYSMSAPNPDIMSGPELTVPGKRKRKAKGGRAMSNVDALKHSKKRGVVSKSWNYK
jgi:hypothetical protein